MQNQRISTKEVLKLIGVVGIVLTSAAIPTLPTAVTQAIKIWKNVNKRSLGTIIKRLEKQELISINEADGQTMISITDKGKLKVLRYNFDGLELKGPRDGKWRLIIFDIPEVKKKNREIFRKKLNELGFKRIQDSVFVCAYPCNEELNFLCHYLEISDFVTSLVIDKFERGEQLIFKPYVDDEDKY